MLIPFDQIVKKHGPFRNVLHVGASTGQEAEAYNKNSVHHVTWIEAIPSVYASLRENISKYKNMHAINACVSDCDGCEVEFNITNNEGQSSSFLELGVHKKEHPDVKVVGTVKMQTSRLDTLVFSGKIMSHESFDFINLDIQGSELLAMYGYGDLIHSARMIYCEVNKDHVYLNCPLVEEIDSYLSGYSFKRIETKWAGNFSWGDALYIKR